MAHGPTVLRLYLLDERRGVDLDRASLIIDRLASRRSVEGEAPEWRVLYDTEDISEAMRTCAEELDGLDPRWLEIFDFTALGRVRAPARDRR